MLTREQIDDIQHCLIMDSADSEDIYNIVKQAILAIDLAAENERRIELANRLDEIIGNLKTELAAVKGKLDKVRTYCETIDNKYIAYDGQTEVSFGVLAILDEALALTDSESITAGCIRQSQAESEAQP